MKHFEFIEKVTNEILAEEINYSALQNKLLELKQLLSKITGFDADQYSNQQDVHFENGIALGATWAALCIDDIIRTRQFIRGVFEAVANVKHRKSTPVHILYAGTGPFATLVLPLLTKYNAEELQLSLLEVNQGTHSYLQELIKQLQIEPYIKKVVCADASTYEIADDTVDILISETMQFGLAREQQVPIMLNLVNQLNEDVIIIPNKIQLDLALMNSSTKSCFENDSSLKYKVIDTLLEFDKTFIKSHTSETKRFELCKQLPFKENVDGDYDKLVVLTSIQIHNEEHLKIDESGLTVPKVLFFLASNNYKNISMDYVISDNPDFEYELD